MTSKTSHPHQGGSPIPVPPPTCLFQDGTLDLAAGVFHLRFPAFFLSCLNMLHGKYMETCTAHLWNDPFSVAMHTFSGLAHALMVMGTLQQTGGQHIHPAPSPRSKAPCRYVLKPHDKRPEAFQAWPPLTLQRPGKAKGMVVWEPNDVSGVWEQPWGFSKYCLELGISSTLHSPVPELVLSWILQDQQEIRLFELSQGSQNARHVICHRDTDFSSFRRLTGASARCFSAVVPFCMARFRHEESVEDTVAVAEQLEGTTSKWHEAKPWLMKTSQLIELIWFDSDNSYHKKMQKVLSGPRFLKSFSVVFALTSKSHGPRV